MLSGSARSSGRTWDDEAIDLLKGPEGGLLIVFQVAVHDPGCEEQHGAEDLVDDHVHIGAGLESRADPIDQGLVAFQMLAVDGVHANGGEVKADVKDTVVPFFQDKIPTFLPQNVGPGFPGQAGIVHDGKGIIEQDSEIFILHVQRFGQQLILAGITFIYVCLIQVGFLRDGFGGYFVQTVPGDDMNRAFQEGLFHFVDVQLVTPLGK